MILTYSVLILCFVVAVMDIVFIGSARWDVVQLKRILDGHRIRI